MENDKNNYTFVNPSDSNYYDNLYEIRTWPGVGYLLDIWRIYAKDPEQALEILVSYMEENGGYSSLYTEEEIWTMFKEDDLEKSDDEIAEEIENSKYYYVDATMEGGNQIYYIDTENLQIVEVEEE